MGCEDPGLVTAQGKVLGLLGNPPPPRINSLPLFLWGWVAVGGGAYHSSRKATGFLSQTSFALALPGPLTGHALTHLS